MQHSSRPFDDTDPTYTTEDFSKYYYSKRGNDNRARTSWLTVSWSLNKSPWYKQLY